MAEAPAQAEAETEVASSPSTAPSPVPSVDADILKAEIFAALNYQPPQSPPDRKPGSSSCSTSPGPYGPNKLRSTAEQFYDAFMSRRFRAVAQSVKAADLATVQTSAPRGWRTTQRAISQLSFIRSIQSSYNQRLNELALKTAEAVKEEASRHWDNVSLHCLLYLLTILACAVERDGCRCRQVYCIGPGCQGPCPFQAGGRGPGRNCSDWLEATRESGVRVSNHGQDSEGDPRK